MLAVIDGNPGLEPRCASSGQHSPSSAAPTTSCATCWPRRRRICARSLAEDYRRMIYAGQSRRRAHRARRRSCASGRLRCKAVVSSLEEAGEELFTFLRFPKSQWKALRTTNALERINEEFRRRTKTQASLPERGRGPAPALRPATQRPNSAAPHGRLAGHTQSNRQITSRLERAHYPLLIMRTRSI